MKRKRKRGCEPVGDGRRNDHALVLPVWAALLVVSGRSDRWSRQAAAELGRAVGSNAAHWKYVVN